MRIPPKTVFKVIRTTAPFLLASVVVQVVLGILNKRAYNELTRTLHGIYVPIVLLTLVFVHATFGILSMVSRSRHREGVALQPIVILGMVLVFVLLILLLIV